MSDVGVPGVSGNGFGMSDVDVSNTFEMREDVSNTGDSVSGNVAGITSRKRFCAGDSVSRLHADVPDFSGNGLEMSDVDVALAYRICGNTISACGASNVGVHNFWEPLLEFIKMSIPDLKGPRGATATQVGQGTSQQ
ncbi:hypothetical protein GBA52_024154 [Prunus armeniaca]|nr:hypothetical protein GBA52_024154 [Prunus armeniaca]